MKLILLSIIVVPLLMMGIAQCMQSVVRVTVIERFR